MPTVTITPIPIIDVRNIFLFSLSFTVTSGHCLKKSSEMKAADRIITASIKTEVDTPQDGIFFLKHT